MFCTPIRMSTCLVSESGLLSPIPHYDTSWLTICSLGVLLCKKRSIIPLSWWERHDQVRSPGISHTAGPGPSSRFTMDWPLPQKYESIITSYQAKGPPEGPPLSPVLLVTTLLKHSIFPLRSFPLTIIFSFFFFHQISPSPILLYNSPINDTRPFF